VEQASRYEHLRKDPDALFSIISKLESDLERLQVYLLNSNRKTFVAKSERQISSQELLIGFGEKPVTTKEEEVEETLTVPEHKRILKRGRKPLPSNLPVRRKEHFPEDMTCGQCGEGLVKIGEEVTEELEYIPAHFEVIQHAKIKCACPNCKVGVSQGKLPVSAQPLAGARPGVGLLTFILISKYVDHLPLNRLEQIFFRQGIEIARQRMCDWLAGVSIYLEMLWRLLKQETLSHNYVQADETYIKVHEIEIPGQLVQGYFWGVHAPPNLAFFEYFDNRSGQAAKDVLSGFTGRVQTDAYAGYNPVLLPDAVERIACMAHIRRRFIDGNKLAPSECDRIVKQISKLYAFEAKWKELDAAERFIQRQELARPELEKLFSILTETSNSLMPRHNLQEHLSYALKQKTEMFRYLDDGRYNIDNNPIERQIRPIALGRKNYLFAGSHEGAKRAAIFYSLLATCRLNKVNPAAWLTDVLKTMPTLERSRYPELLPHRWKNPNA